MNLSKRCFYFDLDGTLIDSLPGIVFSIQSALRPTGKIITEEQIRPLIGPPVGKILEQIVREIPEAELQALLHAFRQSYDSEGWTKTRLYPGVAETLAVLKAWGYRLYVFTNKPIHVSMAILRQLQIAGYFTQVLSKNSRTPVYSSKAEMLRDLMQHGTSSRLGAVIGDGLEDLAAAREAELPFYFVTYGYGNLQEKHLSHPVTRLDRFDQLLQFNV